MKLIIDIGHPADVHLFRNFYFIMLSKGHEPIITVRERGITMELLEAYKIPYTSYAKHHKNVFRKLISLPFISLKLFFFAKKCKPDILLGLGSISASIVAFLLSKPYICYEDTGNMEQMILYKYFTSTVITPSNFTYDFGKRHIRINSTKEISYLHPNYFVPNINVLKELGIETNQKFILIRLVSWAATHDIGHKGICLETLKELINELEKYAIVYISSEKEIPKELLTYKLSLPPDKIHDIMYFAHFIYGESGTMTSEAAILGTPAIFINNARLSYTIEQEEKYGLTYNFSESNEDQFNSMNKALELVQNDDLKRESHVKRDLMLTEKVNITAFLVWVVENYPKSKEIMKENPDFQYNFQ